MNNYNEVIENYKKWYLDLRNEEVFEKRRLEFLDYHKTIGVIRVQIEPTNRCNFNCIMCPIDDIKQSKKKDLTFDEFKLIISKLPKSVTNLCLSGLGEPFLNKDYIKMIKLAKEKGFYIEIYNNGSLFNKEVLEYADEINFSVDAIDNEKLKQIRRGVNPNNLFKTIKEAVLNKQKTKININFTANYQNYIEIKNIYEFCQLYKIDSLQIQATSNNYYPNTKKYNEFKKFTDKNRLIDWKFIVDNYTKNYDFSLTVWYPRKLKGFCAWSFSNVYITSNLDIIQCCQKVTNPIIFGNLKEQDFDEIYNGEKMKNFRKKHLNNDNIFLCNECPY